MREFRVIPRADQATPRQVQLIEVSVALWAAAWIGVAVWTAIEISHLQKWSALAGSTGATVNQLANALGTFRHAPKVGPGLAAAANQLQILAGQATYGASQSRTAIEQLTYVIGIAVAAIPTVPVAAALVRFLRARGRERRALSAAFRDDARREMVVRYLAARATESLSYPELLELGALGPGTGEAHAASGEELARRLAQAELGRLGLDPWSTRRDRAAAG